MALENPFFIDLGKIVPPPKKGFKISIRFIVRLGLFLLATAILSLFHFSVIAYAAKDAAPKRVLIIYSYHEGLPWERLIDDSLRATLASKSTDPIELNVEHADRIRYPDDAYLKILLIYSGTNTHIRKWTW
jgi:hypothetical protein